MSYFRVHREDRDRILSECGNTPTVLATWIALMDIANHEGEEFSRSHAVLARLAGVSVRSLHAALQRLQEIGLVDWCAGTNKEGGQGLNTYRVGSARLAQKGSAALNVAIGSEGRPVKSLQHPYRGKRYKTENSDRPASSRVDRHSRRSFDTPGLAESIASLREQLKYASENDKPALQQELQKLLSPHQPGGGRAYNDP